MLVACVFSFLLQDTERESHGERIRSPREAQRIGEEHSLRDTLRIVCTPIHSWVPFSHATRCEIVEQNMFYVL